MESLLVVYLGLAVLGPLFALIERAHPATPTPRTRRARAIDAAYWVVTPLVTGTFARALVLGLVAVVAIAVGQGRDAPGFLGRLQNAMPFARLPAIVQFPIALLLADFLGYCSHRLRHTRALFRFHAIHHATEELTAFAAARLHPLDEALDNVLISLPLVFLGFSLPVFAALGPVFVLHTLFLHANVSWTLGPLGYVLASPRFHRRHHARDLPAKNFGGVLSVFDLVFGTFELPARDAGVFGVPERDVPATFTGQLAYPFRLSK